MITNVDWPKVREPHPAGINNLQRVARFLSTEKAYTRDTSVSIPYLSRGLGLSDTQLRQMLIKSPKPGIVIYELNSTTRRFYLIEGWEDYPSTYRGKRGQIIPQIDAPWVDEVNPTEKVFESNGPVGNGADNTALVLELSKAKQELSSLSEMHHVRATKAKPLGTIKVDFGEVEVDDQLVTYLAQTFESMIKGNKEAAAQCLLVSASIYMKE